jgi:hypothetical protein
MISDATSLMTTSETAQAARRGDMHAGYGI